MGTILMCGKSVALKSYKGSLVCVIDLKSYKSLDNIYMINGQQSVKKKVNLVFVIEMRNKVGEDYKAGILSWQYTT